MLVMRYMNRSALILTRTTCVCVCVCVCVAVVHTGHSWADNGRVSKAIQSLDSHSKNRGFFFHLSESHPRFHGICFKPSLTPKLSLFCSVDSFFLKKVFQQNSACIYSNLIIWSLFIFPFRCYQCMEPNT
jgi:hypothetical protein